MQPLSINKISMIILMQHDLDAAVAFYHDLGLQLKFRVKNQWAEFELSGIKIGLCPTQEEPTQRRTGIVLQINNLETAYEQTKEQINFLSAPITAAHGIMTSIQDPGGNIIDLYQPTPEKLQSILSQNESTGCCKQNIKETESCCKQTMKKSCC